MRRMERILNLSRYLAGYLFCILALLYPAAGVATAQNTPMALTVVAAPGAPEGDPSTYHFKPEDADNSQGITHIFILRNETSQQVKIVRIDASCSCTTAVLQPGGATPAADTGNVVLAPGQEARLLVTVGLGDAAAGEMEKTVWVRVDGQTDPAATLHVTGTIDPPIMFVPQTLDFGAGPAGQSRKVQFYVGFSPKSLPANTPPGLVSPAPYISLKPDEGKDRTADFPSTYRVFRYTAVLKSDAPLGPIDGAITLRQASASPMPAGNALVFGAGSTTPQTVPESSLPEASLPLQGSITGDLSAQPSTAIFGTVAAGKAANVQMTVSSASKKDLAGMSFTADQPWLSAKVAGPAGVPGTWIIRLTIAATAPAGAQNAHLIGTAPSGERLVIPVMAYIVAEGP